MSRLAQLIPGGCHTYSKSDRNYPANAPRQIVCGKGGLVYDASGREYVDWSMGINNVLIGHAEESIDDAAIRAIRNGQAFGRPSQLEEEAAAAVLSLWPAGEMVKFTKTGSSANDSAIKLARAVTRRQHVAFDETAPFFSTSDWFCHRLPKSAGTLHAERAFAWPFRFNDSDSVVRVFDSVKGELACLILEPARYERPTPAFIETVRLLCAKHGTLLIIDAVVYGYRYEVGGFAGFEPDLFTLGKGMANGYSVAALLGKREYMQRGGLDADVFLLSTTNGAEQSGLAAAIATQQFYRQHDVIGKLAEVGRELAEIVNRESIVHHAYAVMRGDFDCRQRFTGMLPWPPDYIETFHTTLLDHGVLWPYNWCCPCYRRTAEEMEQTRIAVRAACQAVAEKAA